MPETKAADYITALVSRMPSCNIMCILAGTRCLHVPAFHQVQPSLRGIVHYGFPGRIAPCPLFHIAGRTHVPSRRLIYFQQPRHQTGPPVRVDALGYYEVFHLKSLPVFLTFYGSPVDPVENILNETRIESITGSGFQYPRHH